MTRRVHPSTAAARAGLGVGNTADGADLVAPLSLASVRAYPDLASVDEAMEGATCTGATAAANPQRLEEAMIALETIRDAPVPVARVTSSGQAALLLAVDPGGEPVPPAGGGGAALLWRHRLAAIGSARQSRRPRLDSGSPAGRAAAIMASWLPPHSAPTSGPSSWT